jgi:hypothetical protein
VTPDVRFVTFRRGDTQYSLPVLELTAQWTSSDRCLADAVDRRTVGSAFAIARDFASFVGDGLVVGRVVFL